MLCIFQPEILTSGKIQCIKDITELIELKRAIFTNIGFQNAARTSFKVFAILRGRMTHYRSIYRRNVT